MPEELLFESVVCAHVAEARWCDPRSMSSETWIGLNAECLYGHGPKGWHGAFYVESRTKGSHPMPFFEALMDAIQHDLTEHPRYGLQKPPWEGIISGEGTARRRLSEESKPLGVPFTPFVVQVVYELKSFLGDVRRAFLW